MRRDELRLRDVVAAADTLAEYLKGVRQEQFQSPGLLQDAILRQLTVVGEAIYKVSRPLQSRHPNVPWLQVAGFRHRVIHDYFGLDLDAVWRIGTVEMPRLRSEILAVLAAEIAQDLLDV